MVEKISEVSMNVALKGDSTPDDNELLKHIAKKKKQDEGGENTSLVAMFPPSALVRLTTPLAQRGGLQKKENQAAKEVAAAYLGLAAELMQTKKGDGLSRQVLLAVAGQMAEASASKSEGQSTPPVRVNVATNMLVDAATKLHQSSTVQHLQAAAVVNPIIVNTSVPEAETGRQQKQLRTKEDYGEAKPFWLGAKLAEIVIPKPGETAAQSRNSPATLKQLKAQVCSASGVKGGSEGQTLEVNYQFQRWSGDHSVRISVPTEARREGNVTLLPSDARAADVLLRHMGHLTGLSPDLLRPQQERDEQQQQRRQQQQQDEDQE